MAALEQTSRELEPSKHDTYNINMVNQYNSLTDEEVRERKTALMDKIIKIQKMMEETNAVDPQGKQDSPLDVEAIRSKEGETGILRKPEQGNDNGDAQGKVSDEKV